MKKLLAFALMSSLIPAASYAGDMGRSYFQLKGHASFGGGSDYDALDVSAGTKGSSDYNTGFGGGIAFGHHPTEYIRSELALDYHYNDKGRTSIGGVVLQNDDFATTILAGMINLYFDIYKMDGWSPYIGGGVGMAHEFDDGDNSFAYQAMAGMNYDINHDSTISLGYKFFGTTNFKANYNDTNLGVVQQKADIRNHIIELGYRYKF